MALAVETIPFTLRTGTGSQTISHVLNTSIAAKGVIFTSTTNHSVTQSNWGFGVDDATTHIATALGASGDPFNGSGILSAKGVSTQYSIYSEQAQAFGGGAVALLRGYVSSFSVGSFDITLDVNSCAGEQWYATIIGGDDVLCKVGLYDINGGSGTATVGFDPVALIKISCPDAGITSDTGSAYASYGFATPCGPEQVGWGENRTFGAASSYQLDGKIQADIVATSTIISDEVTLSSYPSNGFAVTFSGVPDWNIGYLAIGGAAVSANLVSITQPTSTGVQNTSMTATDPVAVFLASTNRVAVSGAGSAGANLSFGIYDGTSNIGQWWGNPNEAAKKHARRSSTTKTIVMATATGETTSTLNAEASCALTSTNIALNWTTVDSTQREIWALVLAKNLTGSPNNCGANPIGSITVIKQCTPIAGGETDFPFGTTGGLSPSSFTLMDGESQLFSSVSPGTYGISETAPSGWTATYAVSNGDSHTAITVTGTEAITVTTTNTFQSSTPTFRIYRRFALPYDEHYFTYLNRLEIVAQMGVGNGSAPNPIIKIRFSKDGGSTFGDFRTMSLGAATQYTKRAYINRVGRGRDLVAELICDDPVVVAWVQCLVEGEKATGTN